MNPASLIPAIEPIPVHWAWIDTLLVSTFTIHVLFMNCLFGGAVIALFHATGALEPIARNLSRKLPTIMALTINFGVPPLLFLQVNFGHFDYAGTVLMGGWWLGVIPALLVAYYGLYYYDFRYGQLKMLRPITLLVSILCLFFVGFMFANNMTIMLRPEVWTQHFTNTLGIVLNVGDASIYPRYLHMMLGALAVGGLFVALIGNWRDDQMFIDTGMKWFMRATMINILAGVWYLMALPRNIMLTFMGGSGFATALLVAGLVMAGVILMVGSKKQVMLTAGLTAGTVLVMALMRHIVRLEYLAPYFKESDLPITGQYSPLVLFVVSLVLAAPVVWWMIKVYLDNAPEGGEEAH